MSSGSIFHRKASAKFGVVYDAEGKEVEVETREDEEQNVKLQETVDLLLAAGYFRARIKGLSPFDKIVGGMTWCITTCNFDIDVDLLFQENSTIGQKIALTEKIVAVLPRMKCPHRLEPHQIQGLDFIHIFPVVQWLVKRAIETREEMGDQIRSFSVSQFNKIHKTPEDVEFADSKEKAMVTVLSMGDVYKPQRRYRRSNLKRLNDEELRVQSTLLEYGRRYGVGRSVKSESEKEKEAIKQKALAAGLTKQRSDTMDSEEERAADEKRIKALMSEMSSMEGDETIAKHSEMQQSYDATQTRLQEVKEFTDKLDNEMNKLEQVETEENKNVLQKLRSLVAMNESLKQQEQQFRAHCKEEMARLKKNIEDLKGGVEGDESEEGERVRLIEKQFQADKEKLQKIRLLLARKNREIANLQRKIDEVPSRAELTQYQRRFIELYKQMSSTHKETKQFYTLYNTLDDTKLYLEKEVELLNSIHDNFKVAMSSNAGKDQFLKQFEGIVEGVKNNQAKVDKRRQEEKASRDRLNKNYLDMIEKQRLYFKTIKDFKEECRKNEILLSRLEVK
ncbi:coiled-coil domain-containing protein 93-like [Anneissia japonica]|uniref:coiled-coil domain-containing protein 93-like n=1 Tax=Anneissia japonica TaxID=1529436 RepID=UPI001425AACA|nr:coiled-coil domain-containing protein 93-like [Anneissia japonica]